MIYGIQLREKMKNIHVKMATYFSKVFKCGHIWSSSMKIGKKKEVKGGFLGVKVIFIKVMVEQLLIIENFIQFFPGPM